MPTCLRGDRSLTLSFFASSRARSKAEHYAGGQGARGGVDKEPKKTEWVAPLAKCYGQVFFDPTCVRVTDVRRLAWSVPRPRSILLLVKIIAKVGVKFSEQVKAAWQQQATQAVLSMD